MIITLIYPSNSHIAYQIGADLFSNLARRTAGAESILLTDRDNLLKDSSPVVVIGSDAANHLAADLYLSRQIDDLGIRYNTDDYRILTKELGGRTFLFLAGGRPRSTIYAVYRYFEVFCGCRWFWDGDRIPRMELPLSGIDLKESPRFEYRGLRYFAHRSLHRFQAEHWGLEDWQKEIDWILKKRLNLFMLRIGLDDVFQKAFPDIVRYPDRDSPLPEAQDGYNDRSLFWSLEYRGELRKQLLRYAFERDLMHPEDCGTMTHWYSRTPLDFLNAKHPRMLSVTGGGTSGESTGLVWDVRDNENLKNYFRLTETHIREYGRPELFHTIGLAERSFGADREENMRMKLYVYRRIAAYLKENYPHAPLLIASWDIWMFYTLEEVRRLISELDPEQAILMDYTSDTMRESNFTNWGIVGKFPWIFGIFSGYEPNSEIRGFYELTNERLRIAKEDPMCRGLILWPEMSHGDTLITEYLARNSWDTETPSVTEVTDTYCRDRYPAALCSEMQEIWRRFMPIVQLRSWSPDGQIAHDGSDTFVLIRDRARFEDKPYPFYGRSAEDGYANQNSAVSVLRKLAGLPKDDPMVLRDVCDIARTVIGRYVDIAIHLAETMYLQKNKYMFTAMDIASALMEQLRDLLASHEDYSLLESLRRLERTAPTNPHFERTLKNNAENGYCRSYIYENAAFLYFPEMDILFSEVRKAFENDAAIDRDAVSARIQENRKRYFDRPLSEMKLESVPELGTILTEAADTIESILF